MTIRGERAIGCTDLLLLSVYLSADGLRFETCANQRRKSVPPRLPDAATTTQRFASVRAAPGGRHGRKAPCQRGRQYQLCHRCAPREALMASVA